MIAIQRWGSSPRQFVREAAEMRLARSFVNNKSEDERCIGAGGEASFMTGPMESERIALRSQREACIDARAPVVVRRTARFIAAYTQRQLGNDGGHLPVVDSEHREGDVILTSELNADAAIA